MNLGKSVFKDETKLDINYVPQKLRHREQELRLLMEFFKFAIYSPERMTQRVIITGDVGTGKTALAQRFGQDITSEANRLGARLRYVHVNCREYRGKLALIMQQLLSVLLPTFPKRGYGPEEQLEIVLQNLDEKQAHMILALDEFDSFVEQEGSDGVYQLTRLQETRANKPQRVSFIYIIRDMKVVEKLDASTRSTLQKNIIRLENYSREQLIDILNDRVSMAFTPLAVQDDVVELIADLALAENGNARFAIELLWRAGKYADADDADTVAPEHVRMAVSSIVQTLRKSELSHLELHEKLFLLGVARLFKESRNAYVSLPDAENAYAIVCEEFDEQPRSHTQLWKYLQYFSALGILKTEVVSTGIRGRITRISLPMVSAAELEKAVSETLKK